MLLEIMRTSSASTTTARFLSLFLAVARPIGTRAATTSSSSTFSTAATTTSTSMSVTTTTYKTLQVHVVHRHGDRTPITALRDVEYWRQQLVPSYTLQRVAENTRILRDGKPFVHAASGGDTPFGKLTQLGLLQMIQVGDTLRQSLLQEDKQGDDPLLHSPLFQSQTGNAGDLTSPSLPMLHPSRVRVISTDFPRTIQSVQGLLVGLFPENTNNGVNDDDCDANSNVIEIDVRHSEWMIPDPQPRPTQEQHDLEVALSRRPHMRQREQELAALAHKATTALLPFLDINKAHEVSFGVDARESRSSNEEDPVRVEEDTIEVEPLAWNQLAEITKCLAVRDLLPPDLTVDDQEAISAHAAWRWFETLSNSRLAYLAMHKLVHKQVESMMLSDDQQQPPLTIWSAHDSTLVGLLCAYRLERPPIWPEYASYLVVELVQVSTNNNKDDEMGIDNDDSYLAVRFSLNGQRLRSAWGKDLPNDEPPMDLIPLPLLEERTRTIGATQDMNENVTSQ